MSDKIIYEIDEETECVYTEPHEGSYEITLQLLAYCLGYEVI